MSSRAATEMQGTLDSWRARQRVFHHGWYMGKDAHRRLGELSEQTVACIREALEWLLTRVPTFHPVHMSAEEAFLVDDVLGYLDDEYRLCMHFGGSTLREEEDRAWSMYSATSLFALMLLSEVPARGLRGRLVDQVSIIRVDDGPKKRKREDDIVVVCDSQDESEGEESPFFAKYGYKK